MKQIFDSTDQRYISHLTSLVRYVIIQRTFCPLHIRYIFVLSVIHPLLIQKSLLVDQSLSVTSLLHRRYSRILCAPYMFREDPHCHGDDFHHLLNSRLTFLQFFCPFGVCYPYQLICYSTIGVSSIPILLRAAQIINIFIWHILNVPGEAYRK